METQNRILGEVFGMMPDEDEDELPFRVLDDEMESLGMQSAPGDTGPLADIDSISGSGIAGGLFDFEDEENNG
jgi:hypothetical protein